MSTSKVLLSSDVYFVCLNHVLSTEKEEVMGLLIGEVDSDETLQITSAIILRRSQKKKDRVEISPEQLSNATIHAENLARSLQKPMRVLGWYHSHPHITVWPSHIDLRTQATYQMMDKSFVGLIFSVYNQDNNKNSKATPHQIQLTCFQSVNQSPEGEAPQYERLEVPIFIEPSHSISDHCLDMFFEIPNILVEEEKELYQSASNNSDVLTLISNAATFTRALCHIADTESAPMYQTLHSMIQKQESECDRKRALLQELQKKYAELEENS